MLPSNSSEAARAAADADPLGALREALAFERSLGGRLVPHVETAPPVPATAVFDVPGDVGTPDERLDGRIATGGDAPEGRLYDGSDRDVGPRDATTPTAPVTPVAPAPTDAPRSVRLGDAYEPDDDGVSGPHDGPALLYNDDDPDDAMPPTDLFGTPVPAADDPSASPYDRIEARIPDDSPIKDAESLDALLEIVARTVFIPLDRQRIKPVFGTGPDDADLMIIGEAPGADEDRVGEPFVGRAGQLLTKILSAVGFAREDVYIANILKSRPPGNRDPEPEEIAAHLPILLKQIALVQPKVLLCVGKTAGNAFLGRKSSLGALRDREHSFEGLPLFVTYHPAALLRNEQWKRPTWEDVQMMRARYDALGGR